MRLKYLFRKSPSLKHISFGVVISHDPWLGYYITFGLVWGIFSIGLLKKNNL